VAVWQFKVTLVPKRWLDAGGSVAALVGKDGWETASAWEGVRTDTLKARIDGILPRGKSWYPAVMLWGSEERSDIQLSEQSGYVESLDVRFDLRRPDMKLFRSVFDFAQDCGLAVVDMARKRAVTDLIELVRAAAESEAAHFVLDPGSFLDQVATSVRAT
jgi:hypothetical protein